MHVFTDTIQEGVSMELILYLISILWLSLGACIVLYTDETRSVLKTVVRQTDLRLLSVLPLIVGLLLIASAPASHYPWFVRLLGICGLAKAAFFFVNPENLCLRLNKWFFETLSDRTCRLWGIIVVILATALFSWVR
jgi:hypothetical protein